MRSLLAIPMMALLAACGASHDEGNDQVTVQYNEEQTEQAVSDVGNTAQDIGGAIVNDVQATADKVQTTDVDVNVDREGEAANAQ